MTRENRCIDDVKKELYITTTLNNISIMINSTTTTINGMTNADQLTLLVVPVTTVLLSMCFFVISGNSIGIRFAPCFIPLKRRLQTLSVALIFPILAGTYCTILYFYLFFSSYTSVYLKSLLFIYGVYCFSSRTPARGGYENIPGIKKIAQNLPVFKYAFEYFGKGTSKVVKGFDGTFDSSKNYLFAYHPHGVIGLGAAFTFSTKATNFSTLFPGLNVSLCMLKAMFYVPFYREFLLACGGLSCGKKTCINTLKNGGPGRSICLLVGGAREAMDAVPKTNNFTVLKRKGFVKVAMEAGASIVPVIGFGENDLFTPVTNTVVKKYQNLFHKTIGFFFPVYYGRGMFQYNFGMLPYRRQLTVVIGEPIDCSGFAGNIDNEKVDEIHATYLKSLQSLYDKHKEKYELPGATPMTFK